VDFRLYKKLPHSEQAQPIGRLRSGRTKSRPGFEQVSDLQVICADRSHGCSRPNYVNRAGFGGPSSCLAKLSLRIVSIVREDPIFEIEIENKIKPTDILKNPTEVSTS
jgi:hypothetical protein